MADDEEILEQEENDDNQSASTPLNKNYLFLGILIGLNLLNYIDRFTVAGTLIDIQTYYKIPDSGAGLIVTVFICCYMLAAPVFGFFGDRYSRKFVICVGLAVWILAVLLSSSCDIFFYFLCSRAVVGVGEAAYSTVAPTMISDMFIGPARSRSLMLFYAALPVGSGLGYIIGSSICYWASSWRWGLRATPLFGIVLLFVIIYFFDEPARGRADHAHLRVTSYREDVTSLLHVRTYIFTTLGFTSITFVMGSLSWWAPTIIEYAWGCINGNIDVSKTIKASVATLFGVVSCIAGITGVVVGSTVARVWKNGLWSLPSPFLSFTFEGRGTSADPLVCAFGALVAVLSLWITLFTIDKIMLLGWAFIFISTMLLCLGFAVTTDIILYTTPPTRRSTAIAIQTLIAHLFGDALSPYVIGIISDWIRQTGKTSTEHFEALQYAFFFPNAILILGAVFYFKAAKYIEKDCENNEILMHMDLPTILDEDGGEFGPSVFGREQFNN